MKKCKHRFEVVDKQSHALMEAQILVGTKLGIYVMCVDCGLVNLYYAHETRNQITGAK